MFQIHARAWPFPLKALSQAGILPRLLVGGSHEEGLFHVLTGLLTQAPSVCLATRAGRKEPMGEGGTISGHTGVFLASRAGCRAPWGPVPALRGATVSLSACLHSGCSLSCGRGGGAHQPWILLWAESCPPKFLC